MANEPMKRNDSSAAISALATYEFSDDEEERIDDNISGSDDEVVYRKHPRLEDAADNSSSSTPVLKFEPTKRKKALSRLVSYGVDDEMAIEHDDNDDEEGEDDDDDQEFSSESLTKAFHEAKAKEGMENMSPSVNADLGETLSQSVKNLKADEIQIPPEPSTKCSQDLQNKIANFYKKMNRGSNLNNSIQKRKDFRNPSIYEKLIEYCGINEKGTNYPPELYDPTIWGKDSFYDELARVQNTEMEKREKEKKDRTKVEFVTGTKKVGTSSLLGSGEGEKRKSKWDTQPIQLARPISSMSQVMSVSTSIGTSKTTVISAVGTIKKPK